MGTIDWEYYEDRARRMTTGELHAAIREIIASLGAADAMDRAQGTDTGGKYRDESSVYRVELARREGMARECWVRYHSQQWQEFVEQGWVTHSVDEAGLANMVKMGA